MNAVITGANRGIGKSLVETFASSGYRVWACSRKRTQEFEDWLEVIKERTNQEIVPVYFDLRDEQEIKKGVRNILSEKRPVDVLINNAGITYRGLCTMTSASVMREIYEVNVFAPVILMQMFARQMMRRKSGIIINLCSTSGIYADAGYLAYGSSKAALVWITKIAAKELGRYQIRVNGIAPGMIDTDMIHYRSEEEIRRFTQCGGGA